MATDFEQLRVQLLADTSRFERNLQLAFGATDLVARRIESRFSLMGRRVEEAGTGASSKLARALLAVTGVIGVKEVLDYADAWKDAGNRLAAASQISGRQARSLEQVNDIAQGTRSTLASTATLYARLLTSTADVARSELDVAAATEIVNKAFVAGGAAASEQAAGIQQLAQALGSGVLQGDELRSLRENAPLLAKAIADEFNTTISGLKKLGEQGELVSGRILQGILRGKSDIDAAFNATAPTVESAFGRIQNALTQYIGSTDEGLGATDRLIQGLNAFADNFDKIADTTLKLAAIISGALVGRALGNLAIQIPITIVSFRLLSLAAGVAGQAATFMADRYGAAAKATLAAAAASRTFRLAALAYAAGPIGLVIGAAATSLAVFADTAETADQAADALSGASSDLKTAFDDLLKEIDETSGISDTAAKAMDGLREAVVKLKEYVDAADWATSFLPLIGGLKTIVALYKKISEEESVDDLFPYAQRRSQPIEEVNLLTVQRPAAQAAPPLSSSFGLAPGDAAPLSFVTSPDRGFGEAPDRFPTPETEKPLSKDEERRRKQISDSIADLKFEGDQLLRNAREQAVYNELQRAGVEITSAKGREVADLAGKNYDLKESQDRLNESLNEFKSTAGDAIKGFISDMREGVDATEALGNALNKIADKLLDKGIDIALDAALPTGAGSAGKGLRGLLGFSTGTANTGGQRGQVRGVVHGQEAVIPLPNGGRVPVDLRVPDLRGMSGRGNVTAPITFNIDARGADPAAIERLSLAVATIKRDMPVVAVRAVTQAQSRRAI